MDILAWLRELGLERYEQAFRENEIAADILPKLTADDLKDIGVNIVGHRRKLLEAIAALAKPTWAQQAGPGAPAEAPPTARPSAAERRQLTVMFVDLVGSTALSAALDPEEMGAGIRVYQNAVAGDTLRFEGHIAKFMGDGVLAYFGWPQAHEDDAERAVRAGLALVETVGRLEVGGRRLAARIGIATGLVVVGEPVGFKSPTTSPKPRPRWLSWRVTDNVGRAIYDIFFSCRSSCRRGHYRSSSFSRISARMRLYGFRGIERRRSQARIDDAKLTNRGCAGRYGDGRKRLCATALDQRA